MCADPAVALEALIRLGVARLLTSGLSATAPQGKGVFAQFFLSLLLSEFELLAWRLLCVFILACFL